MLEFYKLSDQMLDTLMDCHEREIMDLEPPEASSARQCKGLIIRKMLEVGAYITKSGKKIYALFITELGRDYLNQI